jgi:hypothetical protein
MVFLQFAEVFRIHRDAQGGRFIRHFLEVVEFAEVRCVWRVVPHRQILWLHGRIVLYEFVWRFLEIDVGPLSRTQLLRRIGKSVLH